MKICLKLAEIIHETLLSLICYVHVICMNETTKSLRTPEHFLNNRNVMCSPLKFLVVSGDLGKYALGIR